MAKGTEATVTPLKTVDPKRERDAQVRAAYTAATTRLRNIHRSEFERLLSEEYANAGVEVKIRLTDEQRRERDAQRAADRKAKADERKAAKVARLKAQIAALEG